MAVATGVLLELEVDQAVALVETAVVAVVEPQVKALQAELLDLVEEDLEEAVVVVQVV